ncbi:MAG: hypothetical protein ABIV21_01465 [Pyrinomonadaceae bacterium]
MSNPFKSFLVAGLCALFLQGCGSTSSNQTTHAPVPVERKGEYPFETKEPGSYQGSFVINGRELDRTFVARKGDKWRRDHYRDGQMWVTELKTDKIYSIDHNRKLYTEVPESIGSDKFNELTFDFFKGKDYREFDEIGRDGTIVKYRVRPSEQMKDSVTIDFDQASGLIVRQEFKAAAAGDGDEQAGYLFEIKNLTLTVDDTVFDLPAGYQKVAYDKYQPPSIVLPPTEEDEELERELEKKDNLSGKSKGESEREREREREKKRR